MFSFRVGSAEASVIRTYHTEKEKDPTICTFRVVENSLVSKCSHSRWFSFSFLYAILVPQWHEETCANRVTITQRVGQDIQ